MPPKPRYGATWWGERFLGSFSDIDQQNRLPRGKTYANNGSCEAVRVDEGTVLARVHGSCAEPYEVKITFEQFDARKAEALSELLRGLGPAIASRLLNRELPESLLGELERKKIRVFPSRWRDVKARCSCPDSAVPCKHIAAVLFLTAAEIDKNPFLVFELHGYDLGAHLSSLHGATPAGSASSPAEAKGGNTGPRVGDVPRFPECALGAPWTDADFCRPAVAPAVDFSVLTSADYLGERQDVLKRQPVFFPKADFRELLLAVSRHWAKKAHGGDAEEAARGAARGPANLRRRCSGEAAGEVEDADGVNGNESAVRQMTPLCSRLLRLERLQLVLDAENQLVRFEHCAQDGDVEGQGQAADPPQPDAPEQPRPPSLLERLRPPEGSQPIAFQPQASASPPQPARLRERLRARHGSQLAVPLPPESEADAFAGELPDEDWGGEEQVAPTEVDTSFVSSLTLDRLLDAVEHDVRDEAKDSFCYDLRFLRTVVAYCDTLIRRCALVPQLVAVQRGGQTRHLVRWLPFVAASDIASLHAQVVSLCPRNLVQLAIRSDLDAALFQRHGNQLFLAPSEQVNALVSLVLWRNVLCRVWSSPASALPPALSRFAHEPLVSLFFSPPESKPGEQHASLFHFADKKQPDHFSLKEIPRSAAVWLSRLFLGERGYRLRVLVRNYRESQGEEDFFALAVEVEVLPKKRRAGTEAVGAEPESAAQSAAPVLADARSRLYPLARFLSNKRVASDLKLDVTASLSVLSEHIPGFETAIQRLSGVTDEDLPPQGSSDPGFDLLKFHYSEFGDVFTRAFPILEALGVKVILPKALRRRTAVPRLSLRVRAVASDSAGLKGVSSKQTELSILDTAEFDWTVAVGDREIPAEEFQKMVRGKSGMVRLLDQFVVLEKSEMESLFARLKKLPAALSRPQLMQAALGAGVQVEGARGAEDPAAECSVDAKIVALVRKKLNLDCPAQAAAAGAGTADAALDAEELQGLPACSVYARPVVERCFRDLEDTLRGAISLELLWTPASHDSQTLCADDELTGLNTAWCRLEAEVKRLHPRAPAVRSPCSSSAAAVSLQKPAKTLSVRFLPTSSVALKLEDRWVGNPLTRAKITPFCLPRLNPRVQELVYLLEDVILATKPAAERRRLTGGELPRDLRVLPADLSSVPAERVAELFYRLAKSCGLCEPGERVQPRIGGKPDVLLQKCIERCEEALASPHCLEFQTFVERKRNGAVSAPGEPAKLPTEREEAGQIPVPKDLRATLRPYQLRGFRWLCAQADAGFGSILGDDMGLGKTLQVLAALLHFRNTASPGAPGASSGSPFRALVICPKSLVENWVREAAKFAPTLRVYAHHSCSRAAAGPAANADAAGGEAASEPPTKRRRTGKGKETRSKQDASPSSSVTLGYGSAELVVTSFAVARLDAGLLGRETWDFLVVDEAQNIKNPKSQTTLAVKRVRATSKVAMSGTPVENRLLEYWSIMDFANRGWLGTAAAAFEKRFARPIEKHGCQEALARFRQLTGPFFLRRLKTDKDIIKDLPDKIYVDERVSLTPEQASLYQTLVDQLLESLAKFGPVSAVDNMVTDERGAATVRSAEEAFTQTSQSRGGGLARRGLILKVLGWFKQVCDHPAVYQKTHVGNPLAELPRSGKCERLVELMGTILSQNEKAVIFTQYVRMGSLLSRLLEARFGGRFPFYHGGLSAAERSALVADFQGEGGTTGSNIRSLIVSLKAGGTGLTLTAASRVIHFDHWWNPAVEDQATDRAYRIGQTQRVFVHRLITAGSVEEKIAGIIERKRKLLNMAVASSGEAWLTEMDSQELRELITLEM